MPSDLPSNPLVIVFAHARPQYLSRCLESIAAQTVRPRVIVYQDGVVNQFSGRQTCPKPAYEEAQRVIKRYVDSNGFEHRTVPGDRNRGVAIQQFTAYEDMLAAGERFVSFFDDDVILSPNYLKIELMLQRELEKDPKLFSATAGFRRHVDFVDIPASIDRFQYGSFNWIGYMMDVSKWPAVREHFMPYYEMVRGIDYALRPHAEIRKMFKAKKWEKPHTSQDGAKDMSLDQAGFRRIAAVVNRGFYIGERGLHGTENLYREQGWRDQMPYIHAVDSVLTELQWHGSRDKRNFSSKEIQKIYHDMRRDMDAKTFFDRVVKQYVPDESRASCLAEIEAIWPQVERDIAKIDIVCDMRAREEKKSDE